MPVIPSEIQTFILKVALTREVEASCDDCAKLSAHLVEVLLDGAAQEQPLLAILQHLQECMPCAEEFKVLQDCAQMDLENSWPTFEEMWQRLEELR
ncbi:MAG: hypothetical protein HY741_08790 [Chloroflexi bacterium]|nr:hypothetical protein [Chloroflexota bacterium]